MLSGSCCVILGSRSVRRTCNHRFAETDAGGWQAGKRGISGPSYDEVTGIFVRVNSLGAKLRSSDLALAQITAKWHNSLSTFEAFQQQHGQDPQGRLRRGDRHARQLPAPTAAPAHHAPRFLKISVMGAALGARPQPVSPIQECHVRTTRTGTSLIRNTGGFHFRRTASIASSTPKEVKICLGSFSSRATARRKFLSSRTSRSRPRQTTRRGNVADSHTLGNNTPETRLRTMINGVSQMGYSAGRLALRGGEGCCASG
jgi:hypothetical protein